MSFAGEQAIGKLKWRHRPLAAYARMLYSAICEHGYHVGEAPPFSMKILPVTSPDRLRNLLSTELQRVCLAPWPGPS